MRRRSSSAGYSYRADRLRLRGGPADGQAHSTPISTATAATIDFGRSADIGLAWRWTAAGWSSPATPTDRDRNDFAAARLTGRALDAVRWRRPQTIDFGGTRTSARRGGGRADRVLVAGYAYQAVATGRLCRRTAGRPERSTPVSTAMVGAQPMLATGPRNMAMTWWTSHPTVRPYLPATGRGHGGGPLQPRRIARFDLRHGGSQRSTSAAPTTWLGVAVDGSGRIIVGGYSYQSGTDYDFAVARLNRAGPLDTDFDGDGLPDHRLRRHLRRRPAWRWTALDRVIVGGASTGRDRLRLRGGPADDRRELDAISTATAADRRLRRLGRLASVAVDGPDRVIVGWLLRPRAVTGFDFAVARLDLGRGARHRFRRRRQATIDFGGTYDIGYSVAVDGPAGSWSPGTPPRVGPATISRWPGSTRPGRSTPFRRRRQATIDFGDLRHGYRVAVDGQDRVVVAGYSDEGDDRSDFAVARLTSAGAARHRFRQRRQKTIDFGSTSDYGYSVAVDGADRVLVGGFSYQGATNHDFALARLEGGETTPPDVFAIPDLAVGSDSGDSSTDNITNAAPLVFDGTAEAGSAVSLWEGTTLLASTTATAGGEYSFSITGQADGSHTVHATATDAALNTTTTGGLTVLVDRTAPTITAARNAGSEANVHG